MCTNHLIFLNFRLLICKIGRGGAGQRWGDAWNISKFTFQFWAFFLLWFYVESHSDAKNWLIWKDPDAGKDWRREEKGMTEDEMVGWHHRLNGHEFGWTLGVGDGQGGLVRCSPWGRKELDTTKWLNWTEFEFHILRDAFPRPAFTL